MGELPPDQAQILAKVYMEGKSHSEAAAELDLPLGHGQVARSASHTEIAGLNGGVKPAVMRQNVTGLLVLGVNHLHRPFVGCSTRKLVWIS